MSIGKGFGQYIRDDLKKNDEWYTPPHIVKLIMPYIPKGATVWCPFDTEESYYVRLFKRGGITLYIRIYGREKTSLRMNQANHTTISYLTRHTALKTQFTKDFLCWGNPGPCLCT